MTLASQAKAALEKMIRRIADKTDILIFSLMETNIAWLEVRFWFIVPNMTLKPTFHTLFLIANEFLPHNF